MKRDIVGRPCVWVLKHSGFVRTVGIQETQELKPTIKMLVVVPTETRSTLVSHGRLSFSDGVADQPGAEATVLNPPVLQVAIDYAPIGEYQAHKSRRFSSARRPTKALEHRHCSNSVSVCGCLRGSRQRLRDGSANRPNSQRGSQIYGLRPTPEMFLQLAEHKSCGPPLPRGSPSRA